MNSRYLDMGSRRKFIKGAGVLLSLPMLEALAAPPIAGIASSKAPVRIVNIGVIFGVSKEWFPVKQGLDYDFTPQLKPLEKYKGDFTIFGNVRNYAVRSGVHDSCGTLFTSADIKRTPGRAFHNDISCDQVAGKHLGVHTRFSTIELAGKGENGCGPGYSLAWDSSGKPIPGIIEPVELFNHLFGDGGVSVEERKQLIKAKRSILDGLTAEASAIQRIISKTDREKLDEYFTSIRHIEKRLDKTVKWLDVEKPKAPMGDPSEDIGGIAHVKMMYDLIVAAFQADLTRVISFRQPSTIMLKDLKIPYDVHQLNHHNNDSTTKACMKKDANNTHLLAYFLDKLKATTDASGESLFDNTVVNWSSGVAFGHNLSDLPTIVAGGGGGYLKHKGHIHLADDKNRLSNLWLTSLKAARVPVDAFADSNGVVEELCS